MGIDRISLDKCVSRCENCNALLKQFKSDNKLLQIIFNLSHREYKIIIMHYALGYSFEDIANIYHVSIERIRHIEREAFKKLDSEVKLLTGIEIQVDEWKSFLGENLFRLPGIVKKIKVKRETRYSISDSLALPGKATKDSCIKELDLGTRATNCLLSIGVKTVGDLIATPRWKLTKIKNFGRKSLNNVLLTIRAFQEDQAPV